MKKRVMTVEELLQQIEKSHERLKNVEKKILDDFYRGVFKNFETLRSEYKEAKISLSKQEQLRDLFYKDLYGKEV